MKLGLGMPANILENEDNLKFARQLSCESIVAWCPLPPGDGFWTLDELRGLKDHINRFDLELAAIENFPREHWHRILLDRPGKEEQMENLKKTIRNMGKAGIPCMGYYFGLAGVWGHWRQCDQGGGRGDAGYKSFDYERVKDAPAIPVNEVWGGPIPDDGLEGTLGEVTLDEMWGRIQFFLENLIPVAEEEGVRLAAHPDDPPVPTLRKTARLLTSHDAYRKLTELVPSQANALEFCQGTVAEMGQDIYDAIRYFGERDQICYVHFRNVRGDFPTDFDEVFIDEGDVNMIKAMQIYKEVGFEGTMIPDHSPRVTCQEPWHAGMAFALGYMRAAMQMVS